MLPITSPATASSAPPAQAAPGNAGNPAFSLLLQLSATPDDGAVDQPVEEISFDPAALIGLVDEAPTEGENGKTGKSGKELPDGLPASLPAGNDTPEIAIAALQLPASPVPSDAVRDSRMAPAQQGTSPASAIPAPVATSRIAALQLALRNTLAISPATLASPQLVVQVKGADNSAAPDTLPPAVPVVTSERIAELSASLAKPFPASAPAASTRATGRATPEADTDARSTLNTIKPAPAETPAPAALRNSAPIPDGDKAAAAEPATPNATPERARSAEPARARSDARPAGEAFQLAATAEPSITAPEPRSAPAATNSAAAPVQVKTAGETPHDFNSLVDRLTEARDAALPHVVRAALRNDDFGVVNLQFRMESDRLSVTMNNADPDFAPAVNAASAVSAAAQTSSGDTANQQNARQDTSAGSQAQAGSGQGSARQNDQAQSQQAGERQTGKRNGRGTMADSSDSGAASSKSTDRRGSIYA